MPYFDTHTKTVIDELIAEARRNGLDAKPQDPSGLKVEVDGEAPRIVQYGGAQEPTCCTPEGSPFVEDDPPDPPPRGIKVCLSVSVIAPGGGLNDVSASVVSRNGSYGFGFFGLGPGSAKWKPTPNQQKRSKTQSISHTFCICFPCDDLTRSGTARFMLCLEDDNGNISIQILGIGVGADKVRTCCGD